MVRVCVRLTRKLAERVDGVDISRHEIGDVFTLSPEEARLLIAEQWAELVQTKALPEPEKAPHYTPRRQNRHR